MAKKTPNPNPDYRPPLPCRLDCSACTRKCPQAKTASEIAKGRMYSMKALMQYIQAEEEGLLIMPPCKIGDVLYEIDLPEYGVITCKVIYVSYYNGPFAHVPGGKLAETWSVGVEVVDGHGQGSSYAFEADDFGATVFASRKEAEKALKGGERNG